MKTILLIFSIYLLLLPGIACAGTDTCSDESENTLASMNHADHEDEEDEKKGIIKRAALPKWGIHPKSEI